MRLLTQFTNRCPLGRKTGRNFVLTHNKTATKKYNTKMNININITLAHTIINHTTNTKSSRKRRSPHRQTFYNLHDICRIPDSHHFYHRDIIRNNTKRQRPNKTALFRRPPHQLPHDAKTKHAPRRRRAKTQKTAEIRRFLHVPPHKSP